MFYITPKNSETGKKFQEIVKKRKIASDAIRVLLDELGATEYRQSRFSVWGGISSIVFPKPPDRETWKRVRGTGNEWMPKKTSKKGKELADRIETLPVVTINELNDCIGYKSKLFGHIGFQGNGEKHFGFTTNVKWDVKVPADCEEVTESAYWELTDELLKKK